MPIRIFHSFLLSFGGEGEERGLSFHGAQEGGAEERRGKNGACFHFFHFFSRVSHPNSHLSLLTLCPSPSTMLRHAASRTSHILAGATASTSAASSSSSTAAWARLLPPMARNAAAANAATATTTIRFASASPSSGNSLVAAAGEGAKAVTRGLIVDTLGLVSLFAFAAPIFSVSIFCTRFRDRLFRRRRLRCQRFLPRFCSAPFLSPRTPLPLLHLHPSTPPPQTTTTR